MLDQTGTDINNLAQATQAVAAAGNQSPKLRGLFSPFTANDPQLQVTIDRQRALALGLPLNEITSAMQIFLGSQYVNDFEFNNRAYRVYVQADQQFRSTPAGAEAALRADARAARWCRSSRWSQVKEVDVAAGDQPLQSVPVGDDQRIGGAGRQLGRSAAAKWSGSPRATLPEGMGYAWSGISLEETKAGRQSFLIFGLALLLVYLTLAAQYESLVLPFIVLLGVPLAVLGALGGAVVARAVERRLLPGRAGHAHRPGGQERDPDRRVRRAAPGARDVGASTRRSRRRACGCGRS